MSSFRISIMNVTGICVVDINIYFVFSRLFLCENPSLLFE
jgi:hypothetical protein